MSNMSTTFIGVDVGTTSARAILVKEDGEILASSVQNIETRRDNANSSIYEQSSTQIWDAIAICTKSVLAESGTLKEQVKGIGFDTTCSLVVCDISGAPVAVSPSANSPEHDIILWCDHRATEEAAFINATGSHTLKYMGGSVIPEMALPRILWLKRQLASDIFNNCQFFDLPDYLTYRCTGDTVRGNCSLINMCGYVAGEGWDERLLRNIGLSDLVDRDFAQIGGSLNTPVLTAGQPVGNGLTQEAAQHLGLLPGTAVGSALIDSSAGWMGIAASTVEGQKDATLQDSGDRLAAIAGTSTCFVVQSETPCEVQGCWGPYRSSVFRDYFMSEGGQSASGQLLDFVLETHPEYSKLKDSSEAEGVHHFDYLHRYLKSLQEEEKAPSLTHLTRNLSLYPDLHGNRSPLADPHLRGVWIGLTLDKTFKDLALKYLATCEALALQTRHIVEMLNTSGHHINSIFMSGGLSRNKLLMQLTADVLNMPVQLPAVPTSSVALGAAMLGASAYSQAGADLSTVAKVEEHGLGMRDRLWAIMVKMSRPGTTVLPAASEAERKLLDAKCRVYHQALDMQMRMRKEIDAALNT